MLSSFKLKKQSLAALWHMDQQMANVEQRSQFGGYWGFPTQTRERLGPGDHRGEQEPWRTPGALNKEQMEFGRGLCKEQGTKTPTEHSATC